MVSASSPEVDIGEHIKVKREGLPGLRLISMDEGMSREERERECKSPEIPVCCPVAVKSKKSSHKLVAKFAGKSSNMMYATIM